MMSNSSLTQINTTITICIASYNRPGGLNRLLSSLKELAFRKCPTPSWSVVVVDNHPGLPAKPIVDVIKEDFPTPIEYFHEPEQGIASARNRAIQESKTCDFIAFIDDDQIADRFWLDELLFVQNQYQAAVVTGPVLPLFEEDPPNWILKGGFFNRPRRPTGSAVDYAFTGNVLIKYEWTQYFKGPFDRRMNLIGGSDTMFSKKIKKLGATIIWADEAISKEYNPPQRLSVSWLLKRSYRLGVTLTLAEKWTNEPFQVLLLRSLKGFYHITLGCLILVPQTIIYGKAGFVKSLRKTFRGLGELSGFLNMYYEEYAKI